MFLALSRASARSLHRAFATSSITTTIGKSWQGCVRPGRSFRNISITAGPKPLAGKTFVLTGGLQKYSRDQAKKKLQTLGAAVTSSVSKKTDFVVAGVDPGSKYEQALKLKIAILSEDDFLKLIGES